MASVKKKKKVTKRNRMTKRKNLKIAVPNTTSKKQLQENIQL